MAFLGALMCDPVVACDGITYERDSIELWMQQHDVSPLTNTPFDHKMLVPNVALRKLISAWCEENGVPVPIAPKRLAGAAAAGGGAAVAPLLQKPQVTCAAHPKEQLRVFCKDCRHGVCVLCAVDTKRCKAHTTEAFDTLIEELRADREGWAHAQEECTRSAEQLWAAIQANADTKKHAIDAEAAVLQQQVQCAAAARFAALGAIVQKRLEREELVAGAAASPDVALKDSAAAAVVASALDRAKAVIPFASAAEFRAAAAPAAAVGHVLVAEAVIDPEGGDDAAAAAPPLAVATVSAAACDWAALKNDGYTARELRNAGCSVAALLTLEYDLLSLIGEVKAAGCDFSTARSAGFDLPSLKAAGYDIATFRAAGCSWADLLTAGFIKEVKAAGCDFSTARSAGFDLPSLKAAGYDIATFRAAGCSWAEMKTAGFSARELRPAGCDLACAKAAGFDVSSLMVSFGYDVVAAAGCDVSSCVLVSRTLALLLKQPHTNPPPQPPLLSSPPPQRDGCNLYMTLHAHKVDDSTLVQDGDQPLPVPAGWQIAPGDADDARVCGAHPWQSSFLVFANGYDCHTAMHSDPFWRGTYPQQSDGKFSFLFHA